MYIYASSEDSKRWFTSSFTNGFTITLPRNFSYEEEWECCLKELRIESDKSLEGLFYVCCDLVQPSIACGTEASVLRVIDLDQQVGNGSKTDKFIFQDSHYFPINKRQLDYINIYIKDITLNSLGKGVKKIHCVLHLRRLGKHGV